MKIRDLMCCTAMLALLSCSGAADGQLGETTKSGLDKANFESVVNGKPTHLYVLSNSRGMEVCVTNYGGRIVSMMVPDKNGDLQDVVLGHDSIADYVNIDGNFGALIGRYGNRINQGRFKIGDTEYQLPQNNYGHCLHGGPVGFHHAVWDANVLNDSTIELSLTSPDGEAGFPGKLDVKVVYSLLTDNALRIDYTAQTDKPTIVNLTNHSYFNLGGDASKDVLDEYVQINADAFTPIDSTFMTTGEIRKVDGTPFDFRKAKLLGKDIDADDEQLRNGLGYDHNMVLSTDGKPTQVAASVYAPSTGIVMEVYTTEPGIQFYTGNFLDGKVKGKRGVAYPHRGAICLETQHFPDSPNKPDFPSVLLLPGETYHSMCMYKFLTK